MTRLGFGFSSVLLLLLCSCDSGNPVVTKNPSVATTSPIAGAPLGEVAGGLESSSETDEAMPSLGRNAEQQGRTLFMKMNCAGCHGYDGSGGMGPDLTDGYWRYGDRPRQIYRTIAEGRPQGMPAWSQSLTTIEIWEIVAYVRTFATQPAFTGQGGAQIRPSGEAEGQGLGRAPQP